MTVNMFELVKGLPEAEQVQMIRRLCPPASTHFEDGHFGKCPDCKSYSGLCANIGSAHWFYCDEHRVKWHVGDNLFSAWRHQTEEDWRFNFEKLADYREVDPEHCECVSCVLARLPSPESGVGDF